MAICVAVFAQYLTDASERLDVKSAASKVHRGLRAVSDALQLGLVLATPIQGAAAPLDPKALAALRRLQQRAGDSLLPLLFEKDAEQWEESFATSFAAGMYQNVSPDTLQEQVGVQAPAQLRHDDPALIS
jgi:hypothetical protein